MTKVYEQLDPRIRAASLFANLYSKINSSLNTNNSNFLLNTDLLRKEIKQELLLIVLSQVEKKVFTLLEEKKDLPLNKKEGRIVLVELILDSTENFLSKYYGYSISISSKTVTNSICLSSLLDDSALLIELPFSLLINFRSELFQTIFYPIYRTATIPFLSALLENLILVVSECNMHIIVTKFSSVYNIRQKWYKTNFLSLRNIERFQNNITWQEYLNAYIRRPNDLYNNQYGIWVIRSRGIFHRKIYANRIDEILVLQKESALILYYIEFQDFVIARANEILFVVSKATRYFLTSVVGRVVGLVWKGVIESFKK